MRITDDSITAFLAWANEPRQSDIAEFVESMATELRERRALDLTDEERMVLRGIRKSVLHSSAIDDEERRDRLAILDRLLGDK